MDGLSKVVPPAPKKKIKKNKKIVLSVEAEVTGHPHDAAEEKWKLEGGIKVPCIYIFYNCTKNEVFC